MYLKQEPDGTPYLNFIRSVDEYKLIQQWGCSFPLNQFNKKYKLDGAKRDLWWSHFYTNIYQTTCTARLLDNNLVDANERLFEEWVHSSEDIALFGTVRLKSLIDRESGCNELNVHMLISDVFCCECEHEEPFFVHYGTQEDASAWYPEYRHLRDAMNYPMFDFYPESSICISCHPEERASTPWMSQMSRFRRNQCRCQACRGSL